MNTVSKGFLLIFCGMAPSLLAQKVIRGPYLQQPTAEGTTIRWRTDVPTDSRVQYYTVSDSTKLFNQTDEVQSTEHSITLTQLPADTKYFYRVGTSEQILVQSPNHFFRTAPPAATKRPIRFWAMGDFGAANTATYTSNQQAVRDQFLAKNKNPMDLWVWLGDNAYCCGDQGQYQTQVFDFYDSRILGNTAILPSPGNHEYYATTTATAQQDRDIPYYDIVTVPTQGEAGGVPSGSEAYYAVNYGNVHFISLDSYGFDEGKYPLYDTKSAQYQWLAKDLAANKSLWTIVFFHHPPYTKRSHDSDVEVALVKLRQTLVPLFDQYKVDLVLNGHSHVYERSYLLKGHTGYSPTFDKKQHVVQATKASYTQDAPPIINKDDGTVYMVIGSAGRLDWNGQLQAHPSSAYSNYQLGGSGLFTVDENRLDAEWLGADGQIHDRFTMFKNVNKHNEKQLNYGENVELTASWKGTYRWSTGQTNVPSVTLTPQSDMVVTVQDSLGYLADTFRLSVAPPLATTPQSSGFVVYPNPGTDRFVIENSDGQSSDISLTITDLTGRIVKQETLKNRNKQEIDLRTLAAGTYLIEVKSGERIVRKRVVKY
jgi:acid phosphatase type 7